MVEIIIATFAFLLGGAVIGAGVVFMQKPKKEVHNHASSEAKTEDSAKTSLCVVVMCSGTIDENPMKYIYKGAGDCRAALAVGDGGRTCSDGCIGYGSCVKACPEKAIAVRKGLAAVDVTACTGCGECLASCPLNLIVLRPRDFRTGRNCVRNCPGGICGACGTETDDIN